MEFDLVVVGAGSGGTEAAALARARGLKVALVELSEESLGGVCLNRGCVPSKFTRERARLLRALRRERVLSCEPSVNAEKLYEERRKVVEELKRALRRSLKGVELVFGRGVVKGPNEVFVEGAERVLRAKRLLVAVGSRPAVPFKPPEGLLDEESVWELKEVPSSVVVVGGGVAGTELAFAFRALGAEVTLVEKERKLLPGALFPESGKALLERALLNEGVKVIKGAGLKRVVKEGSLYRCELEDGTAVRAERVVLAVGRRPNADLAGLDELGLTDERGFVKVDEYCETPLKGLYACGDVTSPLMLAHKAFYEARVALERAFGEGRLRRRELSVPRAVYSAVELASVGLTPELARKKGLTVKAGRASFRFNAKALIEGENEGFLELLLDRSGRLLGFSAVGPSAGELVHLALPLLGREVKRLADEPFAHPSLSEAFTQAVREALR
ncbi:MAG: NAD(P)/FAD-dependent oxidoreductase [Aquificae bacterium]|nr:NAD(P)/FAD-dependent oxidoreductase [Aquificota bacterium]